MDEHPELQAEQAHLSRAYDRLEQLRRDTRARLRSVLAEGTGTPQYLEERDVIVRTSLARLEQLDIGDQALCFGRIDRLAVDHVNGGPPIASNGSDNPPGVEVFHIGRLGVSGDDLEPLVVDWRAPVAEPFYRATGRDPMGLVLRRHIAAEGPRVTDIEDERFGVSVGETSRRAGAGRARRRPGDRPERRQRRSTTTCTSAGPGHSSPRSRALGRAACETSSPPSKESRTRSSVPSSPGSSSSRAARAPVRRRSPSTGLPTCSTRTGSRSSARECSSSGRTRSSSAT